MNLSLLLATVLVLAVVGYLVGRGRSKALARGTGQPLHSLPSYYGAYVAVWVGIPSFLLILFWLLFQPAVIDGLLLRSMPAEVTAGLSEAQQSLLVAQTKQVARGLLFGEPAPHVVAAAERYNQWKAMADWAMVAGALSLALLAMIITRARVAPAFRARQGVESVLSALMIVCSIIAILTTAGIVVSLVFEALRFFEKVPALEFLTGLRWEPQIALRADQVAGLGAFGIIPVFTGTLVISAVAMLVAGPLGLLAAIYLAEYADPRFRAVVKPVLEILAGIPTVVYGFFAVFIVAPAIYTFFTSLGFEVAPRSALGAGIVMGIMILPFISSLSDDALNAVPQSMRDGSTALGATKAETISNVLIPAALPGIAGGFLLGISRAIGETMIVVMAAGIIGNMTLNPLESVTTVTVQIVTLLIGDTEFDNPKTLAAFALGLVLFLITLVLNVIALRIVQKYREKYE